jgi:hypothetical protein
MHFVALTQGLSMDVSTFQQLISRLNDGIPGIELGPALESRLKARYRPCAHLT